MARALLRSPCAHWQGAQFECWWRPQLELHGYHGEFGAKQKEDMGSAGSIDGVATFWLARSPPRPPPTRPPATKACV